MRIQFLNGVCQVHYGAVLTWHGNWKRPTRCCRRRSLTWPRPARLLRTREWFASRICVAAKAESRRPSNSSGRPSPTLAWPRSAWPSCRWIAMIQWGHFCGRASAATPSADKQDSAGRRTRARRQGHVRRGRRAWAQVHQAELRSVAQAVPTGPLRAAASFCDGLVAAAAGDQESAAAAFEDAAALFAARCALRAGARPHGVGPRARRPRPPGSGTTEAAEALVILERTGARRSRSVLRRSREPHAYKPASWPLTRRERQVLGLIARGMRDGDIATRVLDMGCGAGRFAASQPTGALTSRASMRPRRLFRSLGSASRRGNSVSGHRASPLAGQLVRRRHRLQLIHLCCQYLACAA